MRMGALGILLLLGCQGPYRPFDAGHDVRFILHSDPAPDRPTSVRPVCTLGARVSKSKDFIIRPDAAAVEVAVIRVAAGTHRLSISLPGTNIRAERTITVGDDVWVVMKLPSGGLSVFDTPPHRSIGPIVPLVAVPD